MKERPILFSAPMVRALLNGSKTQTRRVVKPQPANNWVFETPPVLGKITSAHSKRGRFGVLLHRGIGTKFPECDLLPCPYGQPGDRLWVRQEHYRFGHWEPVPDVKTKGDRQKWKFVADTEETLYEAPDKYRKGRHHKDSATPAWHKRLARFMPRRLSVIDLEITAVRVERLQDISELDALNEGITSVRSFEWDSQHFPKWRSQFDDAITSGRKPPVGPLPSEHYRALWESINGPGSWDANPWVWVVEFKKLEGPTP